MTMNLTLIKNLARCGARGNMSKKDRKIVDGMTIICKKGEKYGVYHYTECFLETTNIDNTLKGEWKLFKSEENEK